MKTNFQVFEYQKLIIGKSVGFEDYHFELLSKFHNEAGSKYYDLVHRGVQFKQFVGVMKLGNITLEVLPKIDKNVADNNYDIWQSALINMLRTCKNLTADTLSEADLTISKDSILTIYINIFIAEIQSLINRGLVKKYRKVEGNFTSLKGKLLFNKNIQKNVTRKERFYCEKSHYQIDHTLHQIIAQALGIVISLGNDKQRISLRQILVYFEQVSHKTFVGKDFELLKLIRKTLPYQKSIELSKMFILNYSPNIANGKTEMICLMFDMNKLWEEYIFRILNRFKPQDTRVSFQNSEFFWENRTIRPDIVISKIEDGQLKTFVIDTKWKIRENGNPDDHDLKQMFAYNLFWKAEKSILLYPKSNQPNLDFGHFRYLPSGLTTNKCKMGFVSIFGINGLKTNKQISQDVFKILE